MTIYIDAAKRYYSGKTAWCHLWANDLEELHTFAKRIGLKQEWFQDHKGHPHYDIKSPAIRAKAMDAGAVATTYRAWLRRMEAPSETDIAAPVVAWLREWKWEVWQEVTFASGGERADIVGLRDGLLCVVEVKKSLTFDLIAQAQRWGAHYRYVAVPSARDDDGRRLALDFCQSLGLGVLYVFARGEYDYKGARYYYSVKERVPPKIIRLHRSIIDEKVKTLARFPQNYAPAGSPSGNGFPAYSSYKGTMERIRQYLLIHQGATVKEILGEVEHHYASNGSAKSAIPKWLQSVESKWCETRFENRRLHFYVRPEFKDVPVGDFRR